MKHTIISFEQYSGYVAEICRQLSVENWRPDYVVGITRGGCLPAVMISHYMQIPCEMLKVSLRDDDVNGPESNLWMAEDAFDGKKILIVDDMNDSGSTLNWIKEDWPSGCFPHDEKWNNVWNNNVRFAVIVNNATSNFNDVDYYALEVNKFEDPQWVVFPYEEWWK